MKKLSLLPLTVGFVIALVAIPFRASADDAPKPPISTGKCMMWKVSCDTATVYLVGSMHLATLELYPLPKEMEEAFGKSDLLVVEVNINKIDQQRMGAKSKEHPELEVMNKKMIEDRNGPMAEKVEGYLKGNHTIFMVAGVAQMVGDKGIVRILEEHKIKVGQSKATAKGEIRATRRVRVKVANPVMPCQCEDSWIKAGGCPY